MSFLDWMRRPVATVTILPKGQAMADDQQKVINNPGSPAFQELEKQQAANPPTPTFGRTPAAALATPFSGVARTAPRTVGSLTLDEYESLMIHILGQVQGVLVKPERTPEEQAARISAAIQAALAE